MAITLVEDTNIYGLKKVKATWASDTAGAASATTSNKYSGVIVRAIFTPDGGGTQPTDAYDVVINDADGYDLLNGLGANLSNAATVQKTMNDGLTYMLGSTLAFSISNAGETKGGIITLYILGIGKA